MKIKSDTDLHVSTTWGASIFLKAGEEREVGDDLGYQALQQGAVEAKEAPIKHNNTKDHVNMRTTWSGQTKVEFSQTTIDQDIADRNAR